MVFSNLKLFSNVSFLIKASYTDICFNFNDFDAEPNLRMVRWLWDYRLCKSRTQPLYERIQTTSLCEQRPIRRSAAVRLGQSR